MSDLTFDMMIKKNKADFLIRFIKTYLKKSFILIVASS